MNEQSHGLGPTRARVLAMLQRADAALSIRAVADALTLHRNSARFHLDALVELGYASREAHNEGRSGRPPLRYRATRESPTVGTRHLTELVGVLLNILDESPGLMDQAKRAGAAWGRTAALEAAPGPVAEQLTAELGKRGFATLREDETLCFTRCPFREVVSPERLPVVCATHQGFIDGFLAERSGQLQIGKTTCWVELPASTPRKP